MKGMEKVVNYFGALGFFACKVWYQYHQLPEPGDSLREESTTHSRR